jgi:hypothetical protein
VAPSAFFVFAFAAPPNPYRADELERVAQWTRENVPRGAHVATSVDWFNTDFPMMHFVALSGHRLAQTRGESLSAFAPRMDYLLFEEFPRTRDSVHVNGSEMAGEVVYRTPKNTFQVIKLRHGSVTSESAPQTAR